MKWESSCRVSRLTFVRTQQIFFDDFSHSFQQWEQKHTNFILYLWWNLFQFSHLHPIHSISIIWFCWYKCFYYWKSHTQIGFKFVHIFAVFQQLRLWLKIIIVDIRWIFYFNIHIFCSLCNYLVSFNNFLSFSFTHFQFCCCNFCYCW